MERMGINPACPKGFTGQIAFGHSHLLQVFFTSGGDGPGMGCRETGAVVARALPEFATRQVVTCYDRHLKMSIDTTNWPLPSCQLDAYLAKQAVPDHPANSLDEN